ncbi:MAG: hypothetical protein IK065_03685 [Neisseriaceae bacterium]|nr:hypothetical protein [Neisseriaceae bacterium]
MSFFYKQYYSELLDQLLWCMEDDFSMRCWFSGENKQISRSENRTRLQMFVNFLYHCIKSNILCIDHNEEELNQFLKINNIEEFFNYLSYGLLDENSKLNIYFWDIVQVHASEKLDKIAKKCNLQAYDDFDLSYPHCQQFREEIEKAFVDSGFPLDWENPIFKVADNAFES